ncbi:amidohydrolase [Pseudidiomarina aestuarii]|uniref:Amidohydrolase n=1 Tax=Pseudidiomarina aestuarii TaxID=624146 RepID=A0A2T4D8B3_9GAMM|nr:amidohydrolase [Pseudidiomarina aestuarii]PTB90085.1 amidohydrolase [Pseudidiomarina aestuarii]
MRSFYSSYVAIAAAILTLVGCTAENSTASAVAADTVVRNINIVDVSGNSSKIEEDRVIFIENDRISAILPADTKTPMGATVIDGAGGYVVAGFAEMHGHVPPASSFGQLPERYLEDVLFLYVANGVTTVRGMLGYPHQLDLKASIAAGEMVGPTLYLAGPSFNGNSIESPEAATQRVIDQREQGWDLLKVHPGLTLAEYQAMARTARESDMEFGGHVPSDVGLANALTEGQRTIDHLDGYLEAVDAVNRPITSEELEQLVEMSLAANVAVVPTQALWATLIGAGDAEALLGYPELAYVPQQVSDGWRGFLENPSTSYFNESTAAIQQANRQQLLKALYDGGVDIIFGTDAPQLFSVPGFSIHHEIRFMQDAGIPADAIIRSATVAAGEYFAEQDAFGTIAAGERADFMIVNGNPLEDITRLRDTQGVMVRGQWLSRTAIDKRLEEIKQVHSEQ